MDVRAVLQRWGLDAVAVDEVPSGAVNRVFRVATGRGRVYLRVYRTNDRGIVVREHALIHQVVTAGLPAVAPLPTEGGDTVVVVEGTLCAVYPEAQGTQISAWVERLAGIARAIRDRGLPSRADERVLQRISAQCEWLADPRCQHAYQPSFEPQVIHGDYQHANLFFDDGGVSAVIDWEQGACMPRAFEVVRAVAYMFDVAAEPTRAFLRAYRAVTDMSDEELDDGARAWGCMSDHTSGRSRRSTCTATSARDGSSRRPFARFTSSGKRRGSKAGRRSVRTDLS